MTGPEVLDVARDAIVTLVLVASPLMLIGLVVGVTISLFQALTQIQEMTLVFVPKILAIFVAMLIALPFMADVLHSHMARLAGRIMGGLRRKGRSSRAVADPTRPHCCHEDRRHLPARARRHLHARVCAHRHDGDAAAGARRAERSGAGAAHRRARA